MPAIVAADPDGRITHGDHDAEVLFGHRAADAVGQPVDLIVPAEHRAAHWAGFRRAMSTGTCRLHPARGEVRAPAAS